MHSEWPKTRIEDISSRIYSGGTPLSKIAEYYEGGTIPWLKTKEVNYRKIYRTEAHITELGLSNSSAKIVPVNSVIVAMYGDGNTAGRVGINKIPLTTNQACCNLQIDPSLADFRFVYFALKNSYQELVDLKNGGGQQNLSAQLIRKFLIPNPPLEVQRQIATILETIDDRIDLHASSNVTVEAMAQAIFKSWFVDFDPVRAKAEGRKPEGMDAKTAAIFPSEFQDTQLGLIPAGWRVLTIADCTRVGRGASPRPINDYMNGDVPWIKIGDATSGDGTFIFETKERVKRAGVAKSVEVAPGDLVMSNSASCGIPIFVEVHGCIHDGWLHFRDYRFITKHYLYYWLKKISAHLVHLADGSVQKNLNTALVSSQLIVIPPAPLMDHFDVVATALVAKMRNNIKLSRSLAELRDTLLPRLISGKLRIPEAEEFAEAVL